MSPSAPLEAAAGTDAGPATPPAPAAPPAPASPAESPTSPSPALRPRRMMWPELDLLRGLAGLAMVLNHTAVGLVPPAAVALIALPEAPLSMTAVQWATFLGSFAPMMFFFITGVGYGLQARPGGVRGKAGLWSKVAVLLLADALLWRVGGLWIGLDFFGFIALSMVLLATLNRLDRPLALALAGGLALALSGLRYAAVPVAGKILGPGSVDMVAVFTGHRLVEGISFPPMPWLGYPLVGFLVGAAMTAFAESLDRRRLRVALGLFVVGAACLGATAFFATHGYPFYRWGRLAPSSYAAGFALLAWLGAACLLAFPPHLADTNPGSPLAASPSPSTLRLGAADRGLRRLLGPAVRGCSLRGVAAFAVVPLHFLAIAIAEAAGVTVGSPGGLWLAWLAVAAVALGLAPGVSAVAEALRQSPRAAAAWWGGLAVAGLALVLLCLPRESILPASTPLSAPVRSLIASVAQLALCLLLALPLPWSRPRARGAAAAGTPHAAGATPAALVQAKPVPDPALTGEPGAIVR